MTTQLVFPSLIRFCVGHDPATHELTWIEAEAIPTPGLAGSRPRYTVAGVEQPDFDPTIPDDLARAGWEWHGGFLTQAPFTPDGCALVVGPKPSLDAIWESARAMVAEQRAGVERRDAKAKQAATQAAKRPQRHAKVAKDPTVVVVVDTTPKHVTRPSEPLHQLALF